MARHGGSAEIHSAPGAGTEVELTLPGARVTTDRRPRVLIVDDHQLFRAGVRSRARGPASTSSATPRRSRTRSRDIAELAPDVVLLDVHMPDGGGVEVIRRAAAQGDPPRFLALSVSDAAEDVIAVIRAGARGYVTKSISGAELADAVRRVHEGDAVFSPAARRLRARRVRGAPPAAPPRARGGRRDPDPDLDQLTPREREVLRHIARGYMYKEIALRLGISAKTVEAHVSAVLRKLQLSNRHELSRWAAERRLVE